MARALRIQYPGAFYHITVRGNERRAIFLDDEDRYRFLKMLEESLKIYHVTLHVYVMMNNHFHLVAQTEKANLSEFMRRFNISYTGWFHYHHHTCGHLFQGRYRAFLVDADHYLLELSRYVHLNPVRVSRFRGVPYQEQWAYVRRYRWSSLPRYLTAKGASDVVSPDMILAATGGRVEYQNFLLDGLRHGLSSPFVDLQHQSILGDDDFVALVRRDHVDGGSQREQPMYRSMTEKKIEPKVVLSCVTSILGMDEHEVTSRHGDGIVRGVIAEMLYRYSDIKQGEIGRLLGGVSYTAVSMLRRRLKERMKNDRSLAEKCRQVESALARICEV